MRGLQSMFHVGIGAIAHDTGFKAPGSRPHPLPSATTFSCIAQGSRSHSLLGRGSRVCW
jgi:hypothetical protein